MAGRKAGSKNYELPMEILNALVSLWPSTEEPLSFSQIHKGLVKRGIIRNAENKMTTSRILKRACEKGILKKEEGKYFLNVAPEDFRLFDFLSRLREEGEIYRTIVHGLQVYYLTREKLPKVFFLPGEEKIPEPVPELLTSPWNHVKEKHPKLGIHHEFTALDVLAILLFRLVSIFNAIRTYITYLPAFKWWKGEALPEEVFKQVLLEFIPFMMGEVHGQEVEALKKVIGQVIEAIPDKINLNGREYPVFYKSGKFGVVGCFNSLCDIKETDVYVSPEDLQDFALVITPPEMDVAFNDWERREVKRVLEYYKTDGKGLNSIAQSLLGFTRDNVKLVLDTYGVSLFSVEKLKQLKDLYEKLSVADELARIIDVEVFTGGKKLTLQQLQKFREIGEKYGHKTIINLIPFSFHGPKRPEWMHRWTSLLAKIYPFLSEEQIMEWLNEGVKLYRMETGIDIR